MFLQFVLHPYSVSLIMCFFFFLIFKKSVELQLIYYVNFCYTEKWLSYVCVYSHTHSFSYSFPLWFVHLISVPLLIPNSQSISPLTPLTSDRLCPLLRSGRDALQLWVLWAQHGRGAGIFHLPLPPLHIVLCCLSPKAHLCASRQWVLLCPAS